MSESRHFSNPQNHPPTIVCGRMGPEKYFRADSIAKEREAGLPGGPQIDGFYGRAIVFHLDEPATWRAFTDLASIGAQVIGVAIGGCRDDIHARFAEHGVTAPTDLAVDVVAEKVPAKDLPADCHIIENH